MRLLRSVTPRPPRKPFGPGLEADGLVDLADVVRLRVDLRYALAALDRVGLAKSRRNSRVGAKPWRTARA